MIAILFLMFNMPPARAASLQTLPCGGRDYLPIIRQEEKQSALADIAGTQVVVKNVVSDSLTVQSGSSAGASGDSMELQISYQLSFTTPDGTELVYKIISSGKNYSGLDVNNGHYIDYDHSSPVIVPYEIGYLYWANSLDQNGQKYSSNCVLNLYMGKPDLGTVGRDGMQFVQSKVFTIKKADGSEVTSGYRKLEQM